MRFAEAKNSGRRKLYRGETAKSKIEARLSNTRTLFQTPFVSCRVLHRAPTCVRVDTGYSVVSPRVSPRKSTTQGTVYSQEIDSTQTNHIRLGSKQYYFSGINNGKRTEWSLIRSVIIRVITKLDDREVGVQFVITSMITDWHQTTWSPITN